MRIMGTMCVMMLLAGCAGGPRCAGRLVPINRRPTVQLRTGASAPVSATGTRAGRSRQP